MQKVRTFRLLRTRHHISCLELANAAGISPQRVSQLELDLSYHPKKAADLIDAALAKIIERRAGELEQLRTDYALCRGSLMEPMEESLP